MKNILIGAVMGVFASYASVASAASIDTTPFWNGAQSISSFGESNTATYGQTIKAIDSQLDSFTFYINDRVNPDYVDFQAYVYVWDGSKATGNALFSSGSYTTSNNNGQDGFEKFTINTGGVSVTSGLEYVLFFSASNLFDSIIGNSIWGSVDNKYSDGNFVYLNNGSNFGALTSQNWSQWSSSDLAFSVDFSDGQNLSPVPVPAAVWLFGSALLGFAGWARRKNKAA